MEPSGFTTAASVTSFEYTAESRMVLRPPSVWSARVQIRRLQRDDRVRALIDGVSEQVRAPPCWPRG